MAENLKQAIENIKKQKTLPAVSGVFANGAVLEMVYQPEEKRTAFVLWQDGKLTREVSFSSDPGQRLVPYSPTNNLIKHQVVLLPSQPEEYTSEDELVAELQAFIHRYVDVSPLFEKIASYYVSSSTTSYTKKSRDMGDSLGQPKSRDMGDNFAQRRINIG